MYKYNKKSNVILITSHGVSDTSDACLPILDALHPGLVPILVRHGCEDIHCGISLHVIFIGVLERLRLHPELFLSQVTYRFFVAQALRNPRREGGRPCACTVMIPVNYLVKVLVRDQLWLSLMASLLIPLRGRFEHGVEDSSETFGYRWVVAR